MTAMRRLVRRGLIIALAAVIASTAGLGQNRVRQANIGYISPSDSISINEYFRGVRKGVHAQNIADQLNFLNAEIGAFGTDAFVPKFINDVVRDVQDIVAGDEQLTALAQEDNHAGFEQFSFLQAPPAPFP